MYKAPAVPAGFKGALWQISKQLIVSSGPRLPAVRSSNSGMIANKRSMGTQNV